MPDTMPARDALPAALEAATPLPLEARAVTPEARSLVAALVARVEAWEASSKSPVRRAAGLQAKLSRAVEALAGGLLLTAARGPDAWCYQAMRPGAFTGQSVSYRPFVAALDALLSGPSPLAERRDAFHRFFGAAGECVGIQRRAARYRATPALLAMAAEHGLALGAMGQHWRREAPQKPARLLVLREASVSAEGVRIGGKELPQPKGPEADAIRADIEEANSFLRGFTYDGCYPPALYRIFTHDLQHHGRWYGGIEDMSADDRRRIRIGGEPVTEVDVQASHLAILHGLQALPLPEGDPYADLGFPRGVVKAWVTACIGKGAPVSRWTKEAKERAAKPKDGKPGVDLREYRAEDVGAAVARRFPLLARVAEVAGCADAPRLTSLRLMFLEAEAMTRAMRELRAKGIPALPVHDALVVREGDAETARGAVEGAFEAVAGVRPAVQ